MKQPSTKGRTMTAKLVGFAALGAYLAVLFLTGLIYGHKMAVTAPNFIIYIHPVLWTGIWLGLTAILLVYGSISKAFVYRFAWVAALLYALRTVISAQSYYLTFAMFALVALMTWVVGRALRSEAGDKVVKVRRDLSPASGKVIVGALAVCGGGVALFLLVSSYLNYATSPSVSTGVYAQMMHALANGFSFDTTLEFGREVSHMSAHWSPIFLLYLPFYMVVPSPVTLMFIEVVAAYSAVIPLWLIARRRGVSVGATVVLCGLLCASPVVLGGIAGSVHEYALLLPLLLWLFYALESGRRWLTVVMAVLVLCVRETAALYLLTVGLYWVPVSRKAENSADKKREMTTGFVLAGVSAVYFVVAMVVLTLAGQGTLITRFSNVTGIYAMDFGTLVRELFFNPALALYEILTEAKLQYVLCLLLPLAGLPLMTKRPAGLVFLAPLLGLNLLSDFPYHFNPDYPYSFALVACLFYLAVDAVARMSTSAGAEMPSKAEKAAKSGEKAHKGSSVPVMRTVLLLAVCGTLLVGAFRVVDYDVFVNYTLDNGGEVEAMDALLEAVDADASVSASARLCPNLAARNEIYTLSQGVATDVVVIDLREEWGIAAEEKFTVKYFEEKGYKVVATKAGVGVVMAKA